jgi:hypothetical protein
MRDEDGRESEQEQNGLASRAYENSALQSERVTLMCASGQNFDCHQIVTKTRARPAKMEPIQKIEIRAILRLAKKFC